MKNIKIDESKLDFRLSNNWRVRGLFSGTGKSLIAGLVFGISVFGAGQMTALADATDDAWLKYRRLAMQQFFGITEKDINNDYGYMVGAGGVTTGRNLCPPGFPEYKCRLANKWSVYKHVPFESEAKASSKQAYQEWQQFMRKNWVGKTKEDLNTRNTGRPNGMTDAEWNALVDAYGDPTRTPWEQAETEKNAAEWDKPVAPVNRLVQTETEIFTYTKNGGGFKKPNITGILIKKAATNKDNIATNTDAIKINTDGVATNKGNIETNAKGITAVNTRVDETNERVTTNKNNIATNKADIATNAKGITAVNTRVDETNERVTTNASAIAANRLDIETNTAGIATNKAGIATNKADIATNRAGIAMSMAMQNPDFVSGETFGMTMNFGSFKGKSAIGLGVAGVVSDDFDGNNGRMTIGGALGYSLDGDKTIGTRLGVQMTW